MSTGTLTAGHCGRQWTVHDDAGSTVAWLAPVAGRWYVSYFGVRNGEAPGPFSDAKTALESAANYFPVSVG